MAVDKVLKIGLIGAGRIGRVHAENLESRVQGATLQAIADVNRQAAADCARKCRVDQVTEDYHVILENRHIDAVLICSPTGTHAQIIEEAAGLGKHIFCEKPIAFDLATIDRALDTAQQAGVKLQIGFNRRFDPNYARVKTALGNGEIGQLQLLHIISRDPAPPPIEYVRTSGGIFLDMTIHDFDMARFLSGSEVEEIYTMADVKVDPAIGAAGDVDTAVMLMRFANGVIGTIDNSRRAVYGYDQRVEAFGSGGAISTSNDYPNSATVSDLAGVRRDLPLNFFMERYTESYRAEVQAFVDAVLHDTEVPVSGHDGRAPVVIALAAQRSHLEGRPVRLSEVG